MPAPSRQTMPDLIKRDFTAQAPNQRYVGDITYLPVGDGEFLYLATVIDCAHAAWRAGRSLTTCVRAWSLTRWKLRHATRGGLEGAIFHSDHGAQYASADFANACARLGVIQSMGAVGTSADNAAAEAFNATLKRETLQDAACWPDEPICRRQLFRWLTRYNTKRRHSWCRYQSPSTYETPTPLRSHPPRNPTPCPSSGGRAPGHVHNDPDQAVVLRDGNRASVGDWVVTRTNQRSLTWNRGRDWVKNGDTWTITDRHPDGAVTVTHHEHRGTVRLPAGYVADSLELAYASTAHRTQGTTVDTAHTLVTPEMTREALYVASTRGRTSTHWYATTGLTPGTWTRGGITRLTGA